MILEKYKKEDIFKFLNWVYSNIDPRIKIQKINNNNNNNNNNNINNKMRMARINKNDQFMEKNKNDKTNKKTNVQFTNNNKLFTDILSRFKLQNITPLNVSLQKLYEDDDSKDFTIKLKKNKPIKVHKFILQCRSKLYQEMFLNINNPDIKEINDYSGLSSNSFKILIKYLYTGTINQKKITMDNKQELSDAIEYFQLNINCSLNWLINNEI
ncbi:pep-cterm sorting domain-containing protein [Anaeramoeba flamelloides]|uniref:Pep-cterm sorting domain-containing protein n=1 Tax=Anaeramoeba flamelloides TaxID=1746091 RepID=A0AAV8A8D1_9EUKA|nr:pep-cterm sorting domain-containing protein [Anaeramoeba flamelloides]